MKIINLNQTTLREKKKAFQLYKQNFSVSSWSEEYWDNFIRDKKRKSLSYIMKEKDDTVGLIMGRREKNNEKIFNLTILVVDPNFRQQGIAQKLIKKFIKNVFLKTDSQKVRLHFRESNNLKKFYSKFDFKNYQLIGKYSNGDKKYQMELMRE